MPTIGYPGGKARLSRTIISFLPKQGRTYVEPFAGRGNLFWAAASAGLKYNKWWLNDIATAPFFEAIKKLGDKIEVPPRSRSEYERQRRGFTSGDSTAILLEPYLSFSGAGYFGAGCGADGKSNNAVSSVGYEKTLRKCHAILHAVKPRLSSFDWREMGLENLGPQDFVILDPPYLNSDIRTYSDAVDYESLVDLLLRAKFRWVLCNYPHPVLCRLGPPFWARDLQSVLGMGDQQPRAECLWANFSPQKSSRYLLPPDFKTRFRVLSDASALSFSALDSKIDSGLETVAQDWSNLVPFLLEMNRRLSAPGRRTDLRKGAPAGLTWVAWVESKRHKLGRSLRTIQYMLKGKTKASTERQLLLAQRHASLRSEPDWSIPDTPMAIAAEMARLVLEMRDTSRNEKRRKQRVELLAEHFLRITQDTRADSIDGIDIGNRRPNGVNLTRCSSQPTPAF
jgi:hypothetical protein